MPVAPFKLTVLQNLDTIPTASVCDLNHPAACGEELFSAKSANPFRYASCRMAELIAIASRMNDQLWSELERIDSRALVDGGRSRDLYDAQDCEWESQFEKHLVEERERKRLAMEEKMRLMNQQAQ